MHPACGARSPCNSPPLLCMGERGESQKKTKAKAWLASRAVWEPSEGAEARAAQGEQDVLGQAVSTQPARWVSPAPPLRSVCLKLCTQGLQTGCSPACDTISKAGMNTSQQPAFYLSGGEPCRLGSISLGSCLSFRFSLKVWGSVGCSQGRRWRISGLCHKFCLPHCQPLLQIHMKNRKKEKKCSGNSHFQSWHSH